MRLADILEGAEAFFQTISGYLNTIVIVLVILLSGFILGRIVDRILHKILLRTNFDDHCFKVFRARRNYARATRNAVVYAIYVVFVIFALRKLNADKVVVQLVLGLFVFIVLISVFLAGIEIVPNLLAWAKLRKRKLQVGDSIVAKDPSGEIKGTISSLTLLDVHVKRANGDIVFIPNTIFLRIRMSKKAKKGH